MAEDKDSLFVCGGCNAKIGAGTLSKILKNLPKTPYPGLLVGFDSSDDAAVIKMSDDLAIVQTLDFFPPMVTDPKLFGQVAAANALSDIYAMGGEPVAALNIVCYPESDDYGILEKILLGGTEKVKEAGAALAGGHSIHDPKTKYGLSVIGKIHPDKIWQNNTPEEDDLLLLTKKLGVGIITTAYSVNEVSENAFKEAAGSMTTLNKYAASVLRNFRIHSCTDITGFGLIGHLLEMIGNDFTAVLNSKNVPYIPEAYTAAGEFLITAGGQRNRNFAKDKILFNINDFAMEEILFDPQTSGGLLFSTDKNTAKEIREEFKKMNLNLWNIGEIKKRAQFSIEVH